MYFENDLEEKDLSETFQIKLLFILFSIQNSYLEKNKS